jgi:tetratricopeptide (TPR) repeat protein
MKGWTLTTTMHFHGPASFGALLLLPLVVILFSTKNAGADSRRVTPGAIPRQEDAFDKILERLGADARRPGESVEAWFRRVRNGIGEKVNQSRIDHDGLNIIVDGFLKELKKPSPRLWPWVPDMDGAALLVRELGLTDSFAGRSLAREGLIDYLADEGLRSRASKLTVEEIRIRDSLGACFLTDPEGQWTVFTWHRSHRGWVLAGVAGAERTGLLSAVERVKERLLDVEVQSRKIVDLVLSGAGTVDSFVPGGKELLEALRRSVDQLKDSKVRDIKVGRHASEVVVDCTDGVLVLGLVRKEKALQISHAYGSAAGPLKLPELAPESQFNQKLGEEDLDAAQAALDRFDGKESSPAFHRCAAFLHLARGDRDLAMGAALTALKLDPDHGTSYGALFHVLASRGDYAGACRLLVEARKRKLSVPVNSQALALVLVAGKATTPAASLLMGSIATDADPADGLRLLIDASEQGGHLLLTYLSYSRLRKMGAASPKELERFSILCKGLSWTSDAERAIRRTASSSGKEIGTVNKDQTIISLGRTKEEWMLVITKDERQAGWVYVGK